MLFVDGSHLPVYIGFVIVVVQHLNFVEVIEEHPAVAAALAFPLYLSRGAPFNVQLQVPEIPFGLYITGFVLYGHTPIGVQMPDYLRTIPGHDPLFKTAAIEKDNGIAGCPVLAKGVHLWGDRLIHFGFLRFGGLHPLVLLIDNRLRDGFSSGFFPGLRPAGEQQRQGCQHR